jgi:hypothetical protein
MSNRELLFGVICSQGSLEPQMQVIRKFAIFFILYLNINLYYGQKVISTRNNRLFCRKINT